MQKELLIIILFLLVNFSFGQDFTDLYGDYLGQTPPGDTAIVFARGIVSTDDLEHSPAMFTPDGNEVYWISVGKSGSDNSKWISRTLTMKRINGRWTVPTDAPYKIWLLSADGNKGYYTENKDLWFVERQGDNWSEPKCLNLLSRYPELQFIYATSVAYNGTLYFTAYLEGPKNNYGIYRSKFINGEYAKPEALPSSINMADSVLNWTPFIDPNESYIIFSSNRHNKRDFGDLYISFHDTSTDTWSKPINMGEQINSGAQERLPWVSNDGKYLFFTRWTREHNHDVYWVSAKIINRLREQENMLK